MFIQPHSDTVNKSVQREINFPRNLPYYKMMTVSRPVIDNELCLTLMYTSTSWHLKHCGNPCGMKSYD